MTMRNRERTRERDNYEEIIAHQRAERGRSFAGKVVIRGEECPWVMSRQALVRHYMWPSRYSGLTPETVLDDWNIFVQDIKVHSGKHRHQGGLVIYILEGEGSRWRAPRLGGGRPAALTFEAGGRGAQAL